MGGSQAVDDADLVGLVCIEVTLVMVTPSPEGDGVLRNDRPMQTQQLVQQSSVLQNSVVVFSKNYLPVSRVNIKRAAVLLVTGQAEPLAYGNGAGWQLRSPSLRLLVPEHIRLLVSNPERLWKVPAVNRREVLRRDGHTCQYCGSTRNLTLDHVLPRSRGGQHSWDNVVVACERCNTTKSDRTPQEAGMVLNSKPKAPIHPAIVFAEQFWKEQTAE